MDEERKNKEGERIVLVVVAKIEKDQEAISPSSSLVRQDKRKILVKLKLTFFFSVGATTRKTWTATRRSFFKRRKGGRSSSRESSAAKELASFSDMASLNYSDSGALHEVEPQINSYVRVERLDYMVTRPVLIIGPLNDVVTDKLISDFPHKFSKCDKTAQKENSPRIGSAGAAGTGSGSGTEKDKSSGSAGGTKSQRSRLRSNRLPLPPTSSSSEDEYDLHKRQKSRTISSATRRNSRDNLLMTTTEYKSSTNPRKSHQKSSPKQMMSSSKQRHKSSENILEKSPKVTKSHSESEVLEDTPKNKNRENFDFTSGF